MQRYLYFVLALALASGVALAQTQQPPAAEPTQSTANSTGTQNDIESALQKEPTLAGANINVQVTDKNVELSGIVPSKEAKDAAEQIAKSHAGGLEVKNLLKVDRGTSGPGNHK